MQTGEVQRQSLLHFTVSVTITFLGFFSTMAITHLTESPDIPGGYFLFLSYLGIFCLISSGGLGGAAINRMGDEQKRTEYFSAYLALRILLVAFSVILLIQIAPLMVDLSTAGLIPWLIGAVVITALSDIATTWLYGTGRAGYVQLSGLASNISRIIVQVLAIIAGYGVFGLAGGVISGLIISALVLIPFCRFRPNRFSIKTARDLLIFSFWALLTSGGMIIYGNIDTIILGYYTSTSEVGLYRIAMQLASFALFSALALSSILYPKFASWQHDQRREWITGSLARALSYSLLLALPVGIGGAITGDRLLFFLYGAPYQEAGLALTLLLFAHIIYVFVFLWSMTLNALDMPKSAAIAALTASAINIPLNIIFIPWLGITGAAIALVITVIIHALCAGKYLAAHMHLTPDLRALRSICIATLIMAMTVGMLTILIPLNHFITLAGVVLLGAGIYGITLLRLERGVDTALRRMMQEMGIVIPEWL
jgi:O-antigen/teichoic acid export membrane protein